MGAGTFPAGGVAGFDPVYKPGSVAPPISPRALLFNASIKQFVTTDANGNAIDIHPVDQIVALRCCTQVGQSASQPELGSRLALIVQLYGPDKVPQAAKAEIARLLADLIQAGDIALRSVQTTFDSSGRYAFYVAYVNYRLPSANPRFPTLTNLAIMGAAT